MKKRYIIYEQEKDKDGIVIREDYLFATEVCATKIRKILKRSNCLLELFHGFTASFIPLEGASEKLRKQFLKGESVARLGKHNILIMAFLKEDGYTWNEPEQTNAE